MPDRTRFGLALVAVVLAAAPIAATRADEPRKAADQQEQARKQTDGSAAKPGPAAAPEPKAAEKPGRKKPAQPVNPLVAAARKNAERSHVAQLPRRIDPKTGREVIVVTNKELDRYYKPLPQESHPIASLPPLPSPQPGQRQPGKTAPSRGSEERIQQIQAEIARLNQKVLSLHNPYLPRPKESEKEREAEKGLDNRQRLEQTQKRLAELQAELARLQGGGGAGGDNR